MKINHMLVQKIPLSFWGAPPPDQPVYHRVGFAGGGFEGLNPPSSGSRSPHFSFKKRSGGSGFNPPHFDVCKISWFAHVISVMKEVKKVYKEVKKEERKKYKNGVT